MLKRMICRSSPSGPVITFSARCEFGGLSSSGNSMSLSLVRPIASSCSSVGQRVPGAEVVQVLLDDHVAAAGERGILVADQHRVGGRRALRVLGPVDEPEHVALVERAEAVHLVDDLGQPA